jgi:hypothetical protein
VNEIPHLLIITDLGDDGKEWEVVHPDECPVACTWYPPVNGEPWFAKYEREWIEDFPLPSTRDGQYTCYMRHELDGNGIDSLHVVEYRLRDDNGELRDVGEFIDPTYIPSGRYEPEWMRLAPGRYTIEAWFTPAYWAGEYVDADSGITLLGRVTPA